MGLGALLIRYAATPHSHGRSQSVVETARTTGAKLRAPETADSPVTAPTAEPSPAAPSAPQVARPASSGVGGLPVLSPSTPEALRETVPEVAADLATVDVDIARAEAAGEEALVLSLKRDREVLVERLREVTAAAASAMTEQ